MVKFPEMNNVAFLDVLHTADMLIAALQLVFYAKKKTKPTFFIYQIEHRQKKREKTLQVIEDIFLIKR